MTAPVTGRLHGRRVLVTRPAERAADLVARITDAGGEAVEFPVIEIVPRPLAHPPAIADFSIVLFVSPAAVSHGLSLPGWAPDRVPALGAVGETTAAALERAGLRVDIRPAGSCDSEGLLACDALQPDRVAGQRVLIVRGEGGRALLGEGLVERGATVEYAEVYRRARPSRYDPDIVPGCDILTATSVEGLDNLVAMTRPSVREHLLRTPLAVAAERIAERAAEHGFSGLVASAPRSGDEGLMNAILHCADTTESPS